MPDYGCVSSTKGAPCLKASKGEALGSLGFQPFLPQKSKEGPRISQIRGHTCPPSTKWVYDFSQLWIQSSSQAEPHQQQNAGTTLEQPVSSFPGHQSGNLYLPSAWEMEWQARLGCSPAGPLLPTLTGTPPHVPTHAWPLR